eukprot:289906_1
MMRWASMIEENHTQNMAIVNEHDGKDDIVCNEIYSCESVTAVEQTLSFCDMIKDEEDVSGLLDDYFHQSPDNAKCTAITELFDIMHCYFTHSFDLAYRIPKEVYDNRTKANISNELLPLARFTRSLEDLDQSKDDFMHGSVVCYHDFGSMDNWFFKPQDNEHPAKHRQPMYASLKDEILDSTIHSISMDSHIKYMNKAKSYLQYSNTVKCIRSSDRTSCSAHHVQINAPMSIQHVLSVILCYHHWSTYLLQVQCFGDSLST